MHLLLEKMLIAAVQQDRPLREGKRSGPISRFEDIPHHELLDENGKLFAISRALGTRDKYTEGHGQRVSQYAARLAGRINLSTEEIENIRIGGLLHDIGKIGFSNRVFSDTETALTQDMHEEIHSHPWLGRTILKNMDFNTAILDYVHYHHERVDGKGYPRGLTSEEIPLGAKIISVADCFDAMTTDRPYQGRRSLAEAFDILHQISGKVLSNRLVRSFIEEIIENGMIQETAESSPVE